MKLLAKADPGLSVQAHLSLLMNLIMATSMVVKISSGSSMMISVSSGMMLFTLFLLSEVVMLRHDVELMMGKYQDDYQHHRYNGDKNEAGSPVPDRVPRGQEAVVDLIQVVIALRLDYHRITIGVGGIVHDLIGGKIYFLLVELIV